MQLVNIFIEGVAQIIRWEKQLEAGENIENTMEKIIKELHAKVCPKQQAPDYPPEGLSASVRALPEWIQV